VSAPGERLLIPADNRPRPLRRAPIPLLGDDLCQMSFGERAALEGILTQLRPPLAVEIGTYEGGSLRLLASHCGHVHTLDVQDLVADRAAFANVSFHVGDSRVVLPELLRALERDGQELDLALVDGDHSAEGVRADLAGLLDSAATRSTLILLHDTMSAETRMGIEAAGLATHPKVVYCDLDFVSGYEFVGGHFDGQTWGGLGLVLTGERSTEGYGDAPSQTLYRQAFAMRAHAAALSAERDGALVQLGEARHELARAQALLAGMQSSASWRLTAPLRRAKHKLAR
jgi:hypothetical protein